MTVTDPKEIQSNKILYSNLKVYTVGTHKRLKKNTKKHAT